MRLFGHIFIGSFLHYHLPARVDKNAVLEEKGLPKIRMPNREGLFLILDLTSMPRTKNRISNLYELTHPTERKRNACWSLAPEILDHQFPALKIQVFGSGYGEESDLPKSVTVILRKWGKRTRIRSRSRLILY